MKVLYITVPSYFDLEISYIRELSKKVDVKVLLCLIPQALKSSAFSLDSIRQDVGIYKAQDYPGMQKYSSLIDMNIWYMANNPTNSLLDCCRLSCEIKRFISDYDPDVIHTTDYSKQLSILYLSLGKKYKMILSLHDVVPHNLYSGFKGMLKEMHWRTIVRYFSNILLFSHTSDDVLENRLSHSNHKVYYSMLGAYDFLNNFNISDGKYKDYILFFGRIDYYKGVDILIESYLNSECKKNNIKLVIAGKDNSNITKNICDDSIIVMNRYIENEELAGLIYNSMFVVLPYRSATQSGVTKSAFALKKPILCTDAGNLPNEVIDGKYGRVCLSNNVASLTDGLNKMISNDLDLKKYSTNIGEDWSGCGRYSWNNIVHELVQVYEDIQG